MKITKAKLIQIIKEEIEEVAGAGVRYVDYIPSRMLDRTPKEKATKAKLPKKDTYNQMLGIIKAKLGNAISDEDAKDLAKSLKDTLPGEPERKTQVELEEKQT